MSPSILRALCLFALVLFPLRPVRPPPVGAGSRWRVWIYMGADNNLAGAARQGLDEVDRYLRENRAAPLSLALQIDGPSGLRPELAVGAHRAAWTGGPLRFTPMGPVNTGAPATLRAFLEDAQTHTIGAYTLLLLWGHGQGERGLLLDDHPEGRLSVDAFGLALAGIKVDVLALDLCDMQSLDVIEAVGGAAARIVGSATPRPALGWSLSGLLAALARGPTPEEVAGWLTDTAGARGPAYGASTVGTAKVPGLVATLGALERALAARPSAAAEAQRAVGRVPTLTRSPRAWDLGEVLRAVPQELKLPVRAATDALHAVVERATAQPGGSAPALAVTEARLRALGLLPPRAEGSGGLVQVVPGLFTRRAAAAQSAPP